MILNEVSEGRWLTPDPLGGDITNPQSLNRYAYALNNPTTLTDPLGLDSISSGQALQTCGHPGMTVPFGENPQTWCYNHEGIGGGSSPGAFFSNTADEFDLANIPVVTETWVPAGQDTMTLSSGQTIQGAIQPGYWATSQIGTGADLIGLFNNPAMQVSSPSWAGTFVKSFVTNFPSTTWRSLTSSNGCLNGFFSNTVANLNPFTPSASSLAEPAANVINGVKFDSALAYAASRPNYLGGTGLLYPFKSSVFTSALKAGQDVLEAVPLVQVDAAMFQAVLTEYSSAQNGECE